jgi:hypothetical protein
MDVDICLPGVPLPALEDNTKVGIVAMSNTPSVALVTVAPEALLPAPLATHHSQSRPKSVTFTHASDSKPMLLFTVKQEDHKVVVSRERQAVGSVEASGMEDKSWPCKKHMVQRDIGLLWVGLASHKEDTLPTGNTIDLQSMKRRITKALATSVEDNDMELEATEQKIRKKWTMQPPPIAHSGVIPPSRSSLHNQLLMCNLCWVRGRSREECVVSGIH